MRHRFYKTAAVLLSLIVLTTLATPLTLYPTLADEAVSDSAIDDDWIAADDIPDEAMNDAAAQSTTSNHWAQCQQLSIQDLLYSGVRYLDLRFGMDDNGRLRMVHGDKLAKYHGAGTTSPPLRRHEVKSFC